MEDPAGTHCPGCGRPVPDGCTGDCRRPLDPDRYCTRCGRRLTVHITPTEVTASCPRHGPAA